MALTEIELKRIERAMDAFMAKRRPPPHIRPELDLGCRLTGQSIEIFEIRPRWDYPQQKLEIPVAKATYVKARGIWKVFWQRADLKWHRYDPMPEVKSVGKFLSIVDDDPYGCFFG